MSFLLPPVYRLLSGPKEKFYYSLLISFSYIVCTFLRIDTQVKLCEFELGFSLAFVSVYVKKTPFKKPKLLVSFDSDSFSSFFG